MKTPREYTRHLPRLSLQQQHLFPKQNGAEIDSPIWRQFCKLEHSPHTLYLSPLSFQFFFISFHFAFISFHFISAFISLYLVHGKIWYNTTEMKAGFAFISVVLYQIFPWTLCRPLFRRGMVCWKGTRMSQEVPSLVNSLPSPLKYNIKIYHGCDGKTETSVPRVTVWHHFVMSDCDPSGSIILSTPHTHDSFFFLHTFYFWKWIFVNADTSIARLVTSLRSWHQP